MTLFKPPQLSKFGTFSENLINFPRRSRIDLNKRFLPRSNMYYHRAIIKILHIGNFSTKKNEFECNYFKAVFVFEKISF